MGNKTKEDLGWHQIEGTWHQIDNSPGGDSFEQRAEEALEEMAMSQPEPEAAKKTDRPDRATHKVGKKQPVKVVGHFTMFTEEPVYLEKISGGKGLGPALYRACHDFWAYNDGRRQQFTEDVRLNAPKVYVLMRRSAKPTK